MHISDEERRARLVARHHLGRTAGDVVAATDDLVALHSSDPVTPHLALWARVPGYGTVDLDRELYEDRRLWRVHAMRRTLFVASTGLVPTLYEAAGRDVAAKERARVRGWLSQAVAEEAVDAWIAGAREQVLAALAGTREARTAELTQEVDDLALRVHVGSGRFAQEMPIASRLLFLLGMELDVVRTRTAGTWRASQYRWARADEWFGSRDLPQRGDDAAARAELARRYLARFGPATVRDLSWWAGWTVARTRRALADVGAVEVDLQGGETGTGWVLADDTEPVPADTAGVVTLLPGLDPSPMGWKERGWFLGDHEAELFDRNGNIGPSVWVDGRVVGGWAVRADGEVVTSLLEDVGSEVADRVATEAAQLTAWLDGTPVTPRFPTPLEKRLRTA